ncbi:cobyric acid synthase [Jeotgalibacillus soli]|uniref:Cobyric acid synthase n=1 Tax=Jeotgalibacillus soli TaxID=889306 RepID=A0A0C2W0K6_9BACL|nr:cobyric acid synthase [Jeotgalibacillus soli]KIL49718.1 cobyric acid synthase [Jeotgalibacillus soli]
MKGIMLQGTSSDVGKSLVATAFCRLLLQDGVKAAPFKSQNMSNNSFVTMDGLEIGRAQGIQAEAAGVKASALMNPILLKPQNDRASEVVLLGKRHVTYDGMAYRKGFYETGRAAVATSLSVLEKEYEAIVIEGAGSPVEMNLQDRELVNMSVARMADVPVILISDIERGGVFASIVGTLSLLPKEDRERVKGIIINKFRGDRSLFDDGVKWIEEHTGVPVLGVLPHLGDHGIEQEDSLGVAAVTRRKGLPEYTQLSIAVIQLPYLSNFTDLEVLLQEPDVSLTWVRSPEEMTVMPDVLIIPGTKSTIQGLRELKRLGWGKKIEQCQQEGVWIIGICGGFQMMGEGLEDPFGTDTGKKGETERGFGLFPSNTVFQTEKEVMIKRGCLLSETGDPLFVIQGYEIHLGQTVMKNNDQFCSFIKMDYGQTGGYWSPDQRIIGTYLHDLFRTPNARRYLLNSMRRSIGLEEVKGNVRRPDVYDELANSIRPHLEWNKIREMMGLKA